MDQAAPEDLDNPVFDNPDLFHLFVYCLIAANHNPTMIWNGEEKKKKIMERGVLFYRKKIPGFEIS